MHSGVHDVVDAMGTLNCVPYFRRHGLLDFVGRSRQAVRTANLLYGIGCDRKHLVRNEKQNDRLRAAHTTRFRRLCSHYFPWAATGTRRHSFATRFSIAALTSSSARTSSTTPV